MPKIKDKKIIIYKSVLTEDEIGNQVEKWRPIHPGSLWAYYRQLSATEFFASATTNYQETALFAVNWRNDISADMQILYKGKWYIITRIDDYEGYKDSLKVYVKSAIGGYIPNDEDVLPYEG